MSVAQVATQVLWWGSLVVLAVLLPPLAFGTVAVGMAVVTSASLIMEAGSRGSLIATRDLTAAQLRRRIALNTTLGAVLALAVALLAEPAVRLFAERGHVGAIRGLSLNLVVTALSIAPMALLQKALLFKRVAAVRVGATSLAAAVAIVAALLGAGVWALVIRQVLSQALIAAFAWLAARGLFPPKAAGRTDRGATVRRTGAGWFGLLAAAHFMAFSADNLIVGSWVGAAELGLYTFAFSLGFSPLTQFAWQIGAVLFPAAAASTLDVVAGRTVKAARLTALVLFPLVPPAVALAFLLPAVLGDKWEGSVVPFQILIAAGMVHAVVNTIGESLSGTGNVAFRAKVDGLWALATALAVFALSRWKGIEGAALAHLLLVAPLVVAYGTYGARLIGTGPAELWRAMRGIVLPVLAQALATAAVTAGLSEAGSPSELAAVGGAVAGLVVCATLLLATGALHELRRAFTSMRGA